jgi:hypothetical protein
LQQSLLPLGDSSHKDQIRQEAAARGLLVADKPDSHDICFIPDGDTRGFLRDRLGLAQGPIVDADSGVTLGQHGGAVGYTIGQRRGLHLQQPAADGNPRYVVDVDVASNVVFVGPPTRLRVAGLRVDRLRWTAAAVTSADVLVQIRAHAQPVPARLEADEVLLADEMTGVAAGQIAVFYQGTRVLGSGRIVDTTPWSGTATRLRSIGIGVRRSKAALIMRMVEATMMHRTSARKRSPLVQKTVVKVSAPTRAAAASHCPGRNRPTGSPLNRSRSTPPPVAVITATRIADPKPSPLLSALVAPTRTHTPMNNPSMTSMRIVARLAYRENSQPMTAPDQGVDQEDR